MPIQEREREVIYPPPEDRISPLSAFLLGFLIFMFVALIGFMVNMSYQVPAPEHVNNNNNTLSNPQQPEVLRQAPSTIPLAPRATPQPRPSLDNNNPTNTNPGTVSAGAKAGAAATPSAGEM